MDSENSFQTVKIVPKFESIEPTVNTTNSLNQATHTMNVRHNSLTTYIVEIFYIFCIEMNRLCCCLFALLGMESEASCLLATSSASELFSQALLSVVSFCDGVWLWSPDCTPASSPPSLMISSASVTDFILYWLGGRFRKLSPSETSYSLSSLFYTLKYIVWIALYYLITNLLPRDKIVLRLHCHIVFKYLFMGLCVKDSNSNTTIWGFLTSSRALHFCFKDFTNNLIPPRLFLFC